MGGSLAPLEQVLCEGRGGDKDGEVTGALMADMGMLVNRLSERRGWEQEPLHRRAEAITKRAGHGTSLDCHENAAGETLQVSEAGNQHGILGNIWT